MRHCRRRLLQSSGQPIPSLLCRQVFLWRPLRRLDPADGPGYEHGERLRHRHFHAGRFKGWSRGQPLLSHPRRHWTGLEGQRDIHRDTHANPYRGANTYSYAESYVNADTHTFTHSYGHRNRDGYCYPNSYRHCHSYRYGYRCTYTIADSYGYGHTYCYSHGHTFAFKSRFTNADSYGYSHSLPYAFFANTRPVNPNTDSYRHADCHASAHAHADIHASRDTGTAAKHIHTAPGRDWQ